MSHQWPRLVALGSMVALAGCGSSSPAPVPSTVTVPSPVVARQYPSWAKIMVRSDLAFEEAPRIRAVRRGAAEADAAHLALDRACELVARFDICRMPNREPDARDERRRAPPCSYRILRISAPRARLSSARG